VKAQRAEEIPRPPATREETVLLLSALAPGPLALLALCAEYALVDWACRQDAPYVIHLGYGVAFLLTLAIGGAAWRRWRAFDAGERPDVTGHGVSAPLLSFAGVLGAVFFAVVILALWIPAMVIPPCRGT
jgi:hypothetical protein